ncbi:hypothetical protein TNCV_603141 [Trichonephila clavipes]|nr:hypothetical protein TNCV_603141 [Trichonephila clavipes]
MDHKGNIGQRMQSEESIYYYENGDNVECDRISCRGSNCKGTDGLFNGLLRKWVSTSDTFVFIMNALPNRFLSATDPVSHNRCTKSLIIDEFGAVSPDISTEMHLSFGNEIL